LHLLLSGGRWQLHAEHPRKLNVASSWYYTERNEQKGPVSFDDLRGRAQAGYLRPTDLVWQEGTADWVRASLVDGLFELPTATPLGADSLPVRPARADFRREEPSRDSSRRDEPPRYDERRPDDYAPRRSERPGEARSRPPRPPVSMSTG